MGAHSKNVAQLQRSRSAVDEAYHSGDIMERVLLDVSMWLQIDLFITGVLANEHRDSFRLPHRSPHKDGKRSVACPDATWSSSKGLPEKKS